MIGQPNRSSIASGLRLMLPRLTGARDGACPRNDLIGGRIPPVAAAFLPAAGSSLGRRSC